MPISPVDSQSAPSASYEVSKAQKELLLLPPTEKGSSTSSEEECALQASPTHFDGCKSTSQELPEDDVGKDQLSGL